jgi:hypothetical protein
MLMKSGAFLVWSLVSVVTFGTLAFAQPKEGGILFGDFFDRDELGGAYDIVNPDPNRFAVTGGQLLIVATPASEEPTFLKKIVEVKNGIYLKQAFSGDFVATVKLTTQVEAGHITGMCYRVDDENELFVGLWGVEEGSHNIGYSLPRSLRADPKRRPFFRKVVNGEADVRPLQGAQVGRRKLAPYATQPEVWYLQLERRGVQYTGRVSTDGRQWTEIGSHTILPRNGRLGLTAYLDWKQGHENSAEFDDFVVRGRQ